MLRDFASASALIPEGVEVGEHRVVLRGLNPQGKLFELTYGVVLRSPNDGAPGVDQFVFLLLALALIGGLILPRRLVAGRRRQSEK